MKSKTTVTPNVTYISICTFRQTIVFQLNEAKCKELRISFTRSDPNFAPVVVNEKPVEAVSSVKLLGVNIASDLKCNGRVSEIIREVSTRVYFLRHSMLHAYVPLPNTTAPCSIMGSRCICQKIQKECRNVP